MAVQEQTAPRKEAKPRGNKRGGSAGKQMHNKRLGGIGEDVAAHYLVNKGYEIVARNWSCRAGEADIVARDEDMLVFVEVKTRSSTEKGQPSEAVDQRKRDKYVKIAETFCQRFGSEGVTVRFDVISLLLASEDKAIIRHYINAFGAQ